MFPHCYFYHIIPLNHMFLPSLLPSNSSPLSSLFLLQPSFPFPFDFSFPSSFPLPPFYHLQPSLLFPSSFLFTPFYRHLPPSIPFPSSFPLYSFYNLPSLLPFSNFFIPLLPCLLFTTLLPLLFFLLPLSFLPLTTFFSSPFFLPFPPFYHLQPSFPLSLQFISFSWYTFILICAASSTVSGSFISSRALTIYSSFISYIIMHKQYIHFYILYNST